MFTNNKMINKVNALQSQNHMLSYKPLPSSLDYKRGITIRKRDYIMSKNINNPQALEIVENVKKKLRGYLLWSKILKQIRLCGVSAHFSNNECAHRCLADFLKSERMPKQSDEFVWRHNCLLHPDSKVIQIWSMLMLILLLYVFIVTPWIIAFERVTVGGSLFWLELTVDSFFFCDILITLNTAYKSKDELITRRSSIFFNYLKGLLLVDIFALFPFYLFEDNDESYKSNSLVRIIRITKVARVFRASKVLKLIQQVTNAEWLNKIFEIIKSHEGTARLIAVGFFMLIMAHITACIWFFTARIDSFGPNTWVARKGLADQTNTHLYLVSLYWAFTILTTVGLGDIYAVTQGEMLVCIFCLIFGIGFYSFLIGTLTSLLSNIGSKSFAFRKKLEDFSLFAIEYKVPKYLVKLVNKEIGRQKDLKTMDKADRITVLNWVSIDLRYHICLSMYNNAVQMIPFLKTQEILFVNEIVPRLEYEVFPADFLVYEQNDHPDKIFFVVKGRVSYLLGTNRINFRTIVPGGHFGEVEIVHDTLRRFSVGTQVESHFLTMNKKLFQLAKEKYPRFDSEIKEIAATKMETENDAMNNVISVIEDTHKMSSSKHPFGNLISSESLLRVSSSLVRSASSSLPNLQRNSSSMKESDPVVRIQSKVSELQTLAERLFKENT